MSNYICEELISEIFERLPAPSLIRFLSVSKSWKSHIASSDFIREHKLRHANKTPKVLIRHLTYGDKVIDQDQVINKDISHLCFCEPTCKRFLCKPGGCVAIQELNDNIYTVHSEDQLLMYPKWVNMSVPAVKFPVGKGDIAGSCNGIICLLDKEGKGISLWNPSIRRILTLPDNPFVRTTFETFVEVGFGFDPIIDNYKIVKISEESLPYSTHNFFVYSMKTETWCAIASPSTLFQKVLSRACFVNGILHWAVSCDPDDTGVPRYILTFDLSTHVFGMISLPNELLWSTKIQLITVINGSLAVVSKARDHTHWIWVMKEYNNFDSWSLFAELKGPEFTRGVKNALQLMTNGHLLLNIGAEMFKFLVYNSVAGLCSKNVHFEDSCNIDVQTYVESLDLLDIKLNCRRQEKRRSRKRKILATIHTEMQKRVN